MSPPCLKDVVKNRYRIENPLRTLDCWSGKEKVDSEKERKTLTVWICRCLPKNRRMIEERMVKQVATERKGLGSRGRFLGRRTKRKKYINRQSRNG